MNISQVDSWNRANEKLNSNRRDHNRCKLGNNTYLYRLEPADQWSPIAVRLHRTDVVTFYTDGVVRINAGGWETRTTAHRINAVLWRWFTVFSWRKRWYVRPHFETYSWQDGEMKADPNRAVEFTEGMLLWPGKRDWTEGLPEATDNPYTDWQRKQESKTSFTAWLAYVRDRELKKQAEAGA